MTKFAFFTAMTLLSMSFVASIVQHSSSKTPTECNINWSPTERLQWSDFKGRPESGSPAVAMTHSGFQTFPTNEKIGDRTYVRTKVVAQFDCHESWVRSSEKNNDYALKHEQGHFDISEIFARKLAKELNKRPISVYSYNEIMGNTYDRIFSEMSDFQIRYDNETRHSLDRPKQAQWNQLIAEQLAAKEQ